jgi:hypothetical protein
MSEKRLMPPVREQMYIDGTMTRPWVHYFQTSFKAELGVEELETLLALLERPNGYIGLEKRIAELEKRFALLQTSNTDELRRKIADLEKRIALEA